MSDDMERQSFRWPTCDDPEHDDGCPRGSHQAEVKAEIDDALRRAAGTTGLFTVETAG